MWPCLSKTKIYTFLILILLSFTILHLTYYNVYERRYLKPLFFINSSYFTNIYGKENLATSYKLCLKCNTTFSVSLNTSNKQLPFCSEISQNLHGKVKLIKEVAASVSILEHEFQSFNLQASGRNKPLNCITRYQVAIIVPYRNRFQHLNIFLRNIHPFLQSQQLDYTIFIVEQAGNSPFNRGMLLNIGFIEAKKIHPFNCFIFHDVDLLPEDDRNIYNCSEQPRHMSVAINVFNYKLPYKELFGGVSAMLDDHFQLVNGFSNMFWGWGGEDDDMSMRISRKGLHIARYHSTIARYTMLEHEKQKVNPQRFKKLHLSRKRWKTDGLNSLEYEILAIKKCKLFTLIFVELHFSSQVNSLTEVIKNSYLSKFLRI